MFYTLKFTCQMYRFSSSSRIVHMTLCKQSLECIDLCKHDLCCECVGLTKNRNDLDLECVEFPAGSNVMTSLRCRHVTFDMSRGATCQ